MAFKDLDMINLLSLLKNNRQKIYTQIIDDSESGTSGLVTEKQLKADAMELAALILANAEADTTTSVGAIQHAMQTTYLASADLDPSIAAEFGLVPTDGGYYDSTTGTTYETITAKIQADAESIVENFTLVSGSTIQASVDELTSAILETNDLINGQIRRGFIDVVETVDGVQTTVRYFGIAISSQEIFTTSTETFKPDGSDEVYYQIDSGKCFGLYTATGWQFWVDDKKLGWFDSSDGNLHVDNISIDANLTMGDWILRHKKDSNNNNTFGIKFVGA